MMPFALNASVPAALPVPATPTASSLCFDFMPNATVLPNRSGYAFAAGTWAGPLFDPATRDWLDDGTVNCSFFDTSVAAFCEQFRWIDASPRERCCACGGGTQTAPPPPPISPPSLPPSPPPPPAPPCFDSWRKRPRNWHLIHEDGSGWAPHGPRRCDWFASDSARCHKYKWVDALPQEVCCACGGGTESTPSPPTPPSPPSPPSPPPYPTLPPYPKLPSPMLPPQSPPPTLSPPPLPPQSPPPNPSPPLPLLPLMFPPPLLDVPVWHSPRSPPPLLPKFVIPDQAAQTDKQSVLSMDYWPAILVICILFVFMFVAVIARKACRRSISPNNESTNKVGQHMGVGLPQTPQFAIGQVGGSWRASSRASPRLFGRMFSGGANQERISGSIPGWRGAPPGARGHTSSTREEGRVSLLDEISVAQVV